MAPPQRPFPPFDPLAESQEGNAAWAPRELPPIAEVRAGVLQPEALVTAARRHSPLSSGDRIGDFTLLEMLGIGGAGEVYRCQDAAGAQYAIKVAHRRKSVRPTEKLLQQQNELEALSRLRHPSLVRVHTGGLLEGGDFYIVMELVEGETLGTYLRRKGRLDVLEAVVLLREVSQALAYCHRHSVLHLDLKPHNILLVDPHTARLKLLDFGFARLLGSADDLGSTAVTGTYGYMAPECLRGRSGANERADLYSLGVVFYELLSGVLPFDGARPDQALKNQLSGNIVPLRQHLPSIPRQVERLIEALLAVNPEYRYPTAARLQAELQALSYVVLAGARDIVRGESAVNTPTVVPYEVPFVGRRRELAQVLERLDHVVARRRSSAVVIEGVAGVGKSRMLSEFLQLPRLRDGALFALGRCRKLDGLVPYAPIREALSRLAHVLAQRLRHAAGETQRALGAGLAGDGAILLSLVPELGQLVPRAAEPDSGIQAPGGTGEVARGMAHLFRSLAQLRPLIIAIEDLHWADEATLVVLGELCRADDLGPVMLVGTARGRTAQLAHLESLQLGPLAVEENDALLVALVDGEADVVKALKRIIPLTREGNPLLSTQIVRHLEAEGLIWRVDDGSVALSPVIEHNYQPPDSVSQVLGRIVEHLPESARLVLSVAALMDRQFLPSEVVGLGIFGAAEIDEALSRASRLHLCLVTPEACSFTHELVRSQLAATLPAADLPALHARIAAQLRRRGSPSGALAHHLERSGQISEAARAYHDAGVEAYRLHDPRGAYQQLEHAIDLLASCPQLEAGDEQLLLRTVYQLCRVGGLLGSHERALQRLASARARLGDGWAEHPALTSACARLHYVQGDFVRALDFSRRCLNVAGDERELRMFQCAPANIVGRALCASGKFHESIAPLRRGCELAEEAREYEEVSHSEGLLAVALAFTGNYALAAERCTLSESLARRLASPVRVLGALFYKAAIAEAGFTWQIGLRATAQLLAIAEQRQIGGLYLYLGTMFAGRSSYHAGYVKRAAVLLKNSLRLGEKLRIGLGAGWAHAYLGDVLMAEGDLQAAAESYARGLEVSNTSRPDEYAAPMCLMGLAQCSAYQGQPLAIMTAAGDEALARLHASGNRSTRAHALQRYAEALEHLGEHARGAFIRAERAALLLELGIASCDWKPDLVGSSSAATEWLGGSKASEAVSLHEHLASTEGYVPEFLQNTTSRGGHAPGGTNG
jgi:tetratricopeptide (TPR) repeat protein